MSSQGESSEKESEEPECVCSSEFKKGRARARAREWNQLNDGLIDYYWHLRDSEMNVCVPMSEIVSASE